MRMYASLVMVLAAQLSLTSGIAQGTLYFRNTALGQLDAPIFDAQGNRLAGNQFQAILYAGPTSDSLQPIEPSAGFFTGASAGYFVAGARLVPTVGLGSVAWAQVRAWDARLG